VKQAPNIVSRRPRLRQTETAWLRESKDARCGDEQPHWFSETFSCASPRQTFVPPTEFLHFLDFVFLNSLAHCAGCCSSASGFNQHAKFLGIFNKSMKHVLLNRKNRAKFGFCGMKQTESRSEKRSRKPGMVHRRVTLARYQTSNDGFSDPI